MKLRIGRLSIIASTDKGDFGVDHKFDGGMNLIRAENAAGKSTILRAIIYTLGLEGLFSPSHDVPLPHVLTEYVDLPAGRAIVSSAQVTLEIHNESDESLTVTRAIAGPRDKRLIAVRDGGGLTDPKHAGPSSDFYVRVGGAARSEHGFHARLASFIGWQLPEVSSFDSDPVLLYMETIFPLFSVEQKLGWGRIPARFPTWLSIKDVRRRTIEFLLALDAYAIAEERLAIQAEVSRLRHAWNETKDLAAKRAIANGAILNSLPHEPISMWPPEPSPQIYLGTSQSGWEALPVHIERLKTRKQAFKTESIPTAGEQDEKLRLTLEQAEEGTSQRELVLRRSLEDLEGQISEAESLEEHIQSLQEDQRKYKELRKLRNLGADSVAEVIHGACPTCNQEISDSLMDLGKRATTMSVEQNITFYDEQLQLGQAVLENAKKEISATEAQIAATREQLNQLRAQVRSIRETLSSPMNTPSIEALTERLRLDQRIERLEELKDFFTDATTKFANMSDEWATVQERIRKLPKGNLSPRDFEKLKALQESVQQQLRLYGFGSVDPALVTISPDNYEPELSDMNLAADAAASDVIRLQWAYLIALMQVSMQFGGRHPKMIMFDEPQQQSAEDNDFFKMLRYLAKIPGAQAIVATSHERESIKLLAAQETALHLWELGDQKLITKRT